MIGIIKIVFFGRGAAYKELAAWRRFALQKSGWRSFISGKTRNLEVHHGFHVSRYPIFALSRWNDWVMTDQEHRLHPRSYHLWERKYLKGFLLRALVAETPIGLYVWLWFHWHWWKGWGFLAVAGILLYQMKNT